MELAGFGYVSERCKLENVTKAIFTGGQVRCDKTSPREAGNGEFAGIDEFLMDGILDGVERLVEKLPQTIDPFFQKNLH